MANPITSALALPYTLSSSLYVGIADTTSTRAVDLPLGTYRHFLAYVSGATPGGNSGTEADPHEAGKYLQHWLNAAGTLTNYTVALGTDGRWTIANNTGASSTLTWDGSVVAGQTTSAVLARLYGFTGNVTIGAGATATATHQPFGFAATDARAGTTGRTYDPPKLVAARMPDGSVYGWSDGYTGSYQSFDVTWLPKDAATKSSYGSNSTPAYPASITRERAVLTLPTASYTLPYSWWEAVTASVGLRCGFAQGNLQALIAGSQTAFLDAYVDPSTLTRGGALKPMVANWDAFWRWEGVTLLTRAQGTR